ncbi:DNA helicase Pif1-like protein [Artemisia annua]|uniref:DNA helicase Pif1-like protein n=1 Tax=Artemisia annua TaxID=35608 RepID=A0A2U1PNK3_ARTAN|nr:DNA helicase Pif1-like protein [Artemisia annua]
MKQKSKTTPENIRPHLLQNKKINIRDNTHGLVDCDAQNYNKQNYSCPLFVPSSASSISSATVDKVDTNSLKANIDQKSSNVKNHEAEIHYVRVAGTSQSGPPNFFSPLRRKQSNLFRPLGNTVGASYPNAVTEANNDLLEQREEAAHSGPQQNCERGSPRDESKLTPMHHDCLQVNPLEPFKQGIANSFDHRCERSEENLTLGVCSTLNGSVHDSGDGSPSDVMKGSFPPKRKRGRPRNTCKIAPVQRNCLESNAQVHAPSVMHTPLQPLQSDATCFSDASERQEETTEPAARYVHQQNSMVDLHANLDASLDGAGEGPSSDVIEQTFRQTRKRGRLRNAMANSHGTENNRAKELDAPTSLLRPVVMIIQISEGSTSYAPDNTSPAYDDLGDCTECCNYCNAAFWRGERLAGHAYGSHVSHYHFCCGNDSPPLDPEIVQGLIHFLDAHNELVQIFRTARDKCAGADVPEFKIRLYSGEGPRGYELPSSNSLGAIVFDRGPESESNYDVVLEYRNGLVKRISKIHKSYMSLQFPLIFIYGQPGFHTKLMLRTANPDDEPKSAPKLLQAPSGSSQTAVALTNEQSSEQKKGDETSEASVALPEKEVDQGKELHQHDLQTPDKMLIQNQETSGRTIEIPNFIASKTPFTCAIADYFMKRVARKKNEETSKGPVNLPKKEVEQGKEPHKHNLETPDKMLIGTQETSGTPPETIALIKQEPLKTTNEQNTPQESSTKTVKRVLFENQPSQSKKQKVD